MDYMLLLHYAIVALECIRHLVSFDEFINLSLIAFNFELKPDYKTFNTRLMVKLKVS
jgi:hypothetical protein